MGKDQKSFIEDLMGIQKKHTKGPKEIDIYP